MQQRGPEFRYLISMPEQYFVGISAVDKKFSIFVTSKEGDMANTFAGVCSPKYGSSTPGIRVMHANDIDHPSAHSPDPGEDDVPHIHYEHTTATSINRSIINKGLHHFNKCVPKPHGLSQEIIDDIEKQFKEFKIKVNAGELKAGDVFEASNNNAYNAHKGTKPSNKMPSIRQHADCVRNNKVSQGCDLSSDSTRWMIPRLATTQNTDLPAPKLLSQTAVSSSENSTSVASLATAIIVAGALLIKFGFLSCLTKRCSKQKQVQQSEVRVFQRT